MKLVLGLDLLVFFFVVGCKKNKNKNKLEELEDKEIVDNLK